VKLLLPPPFFRCATLFCRRPRPCEIFIQRFIKPFARVAGLHTAFRESATVGAFVRATVGAAELTVRAAGLTVRAGRLTVRAAGLTVRAGRLTVRAGRLTVAAELTVRAGRLTVAGPAARTLAGPADALGQRS
jgi:adhesin HecA-like repeat protein